MLLSGATSADGYQTVTVNDATTPVTIRDAFNGTWVVDNLDLYFIKTASCASNQIEVHRLTSASKYTMWAIQTPTAFAAAEASNGTFTIDNGDLYFIKPQNTASGMVEVHIASAGNNFRTVDFHGVSAFQPADAANGYFRIRNGDLYLIKTRDMGSGMVEVHIAARSNDYKDIEHFKLNFGLADDKNGTWDIGANGDMVFIQQWNCASNHVEIHLAHRASGYVKIFDYASAFNQGAGFWCIW